MRSRNPPRVRISGPWGSFFGGRLALLAGCVLGLSGFVTPIVNPDLYWHLSAGRRILSTLAVPRKDWLSHTMPSAPWVDFEWLIQAVYGLVHAACGCLGLIVLKALVLGLAVWALLEVLRLHGTGPAGRGVAAMWISAGLLPSSDVRPDNFSLLFFAALILGLEAERLGAWKPRRGGLLAVGGLFCVWANMHLGFLYGLALISLHSAGEALQEARGGPQDGPAGVHGARARRLAALALAGAAAAVLNPFGTEVYKVAAEHALSLRFIGGALNEWTPPLVSIAGFAPYWALLAASFVAAISHLAFTGRTNLGWCLCLLFFGAASSLHRRDVPYFVLAAAPALWAILADVRSRARGSTALVLGRTAAAMGAIGFFLLTADIGQIAWRSMLPGSPWGWCQTPGRRAVEFLLAERSELAGKRLYHGWGQGGYFGFVLHPWYSVYYDGRYIFHPLLAETETAQRDPSAWSALMDRRKVEAAVLKRDFGSTRQGLGWRAFMPAKVWALVYQDDRHLIVVRRASVGKAWLSRKEL